MADKGDFKGDLENLTKAGTKAAASGAQIGAAVRAALPDGIASGVAGALAGLVTMNDVDGGDNKCTSQVPASETDAVTNAVKAVKSSKTQEMLGKMSTISSYTASPNVTKPSKNVDFNNLEIPQVLKDLPKNLKEK